MYATALLYYVELSLHHVELTQQQLNKCTAAHAIHTIIAIYVRYVYVHDGMCTYQCLLLSSVVFVH
jgi:hypothetical protein